jgi:acyl carrier protein
VDSMREKLLAYINGELLESRRSADLDSPLFEDGWIDSLKILQLIAYLEVLCGRKIPDEEIVMENFATVTTIAGHFLLT